MNNKYLLFLILPMLLVSSGCAVQIPDLFNSGQTASPVDTTIDISGVVGTTKTVVINRMQYVVGFEKTSTGAKYMIYPPSYPLGYEGQLTSGNSVTIIVSSDKIYAMGNARPEIWNAGGKWRAGDTFTLSLNGNICGVKWSQTGNTDPSASIIVTPENPSPDQTVRLTADVSTGGDSDEIFTQWYLDGRDMEGWIYNVPETSPYVRTLKELPSGSHTIELLIWDTGKNEKRITKTINLMGEIREPTALFIVSPESPAPNTDFYLYSTSTPNTDPNLNQRLTHEWYLDGIFLGSSTDHSMKVGKEKGLATAGTHFVKLKVTNSEGLSTEVTKSFVIPSPSIPGEPTPVPTGCTVACGDDEQCVNGQCVPLPEASPLPKGTFTITAYNNQVGSQNNYIFRYRGHSIGKSDPSYQTVDWYIDEMSLTYNGFAVEQWPMGSLFVSWNPLYQNYNELKNNPPPYTTLANWSSDVQYSGIKGGNTLDQGAGWSKSAKYFITAITEQYATIQITETVNTFTYCGDGTCQENCATCPADCGICTDEQKILYNQAPNARFEYTKNNREVILTSKSSDPDGSIKSLVWVFGDGNSKENGDIMERYTYPDYGTYTITLFVKDNLDAISKTTATVTLIPPLAYEDQDTDGDGVKNSTDSCVLQSGSASNNGCPVVASINTSTVTATCGDNICQENCATCPADCGSCPVTTPDDTTTATVSGTTGATTATVSGISTDSEDVANAYSSITGAGTSTGNLPVDIPYDIGYYIGKIKSFLLREFFGLPYWSMGVGIFLLFYILGGGKGKKISIWGKKR